MLSPVLSLSVYTRRHQPSCCFDCGLPVIIKLKMFQCALILLPCTQVIRIGLHLVNSHHLLRFERQLRGLTSQELYIFFRCLYDKCDSDTTFAVCRHLTLHLVYGLGHQYKVAVQKVPEGCSTNGSTTEVHTPCSTCMSMVDC